MRVAVVAEYYPSRAAPALGIWAHRQAVAAQAGGADVRVLVLHRPLPSLAELRTRGVRSLGGPLREQMSEERDGVEIRRVPFLAPPRPWSYGAWSLYASPSLAVALRALRRHFPFEVVHAHYAAPAGDAVRLACPGVPLVVSVHGGDVLGVVRDWPRAGGPAVRRALRSARLVLANSRGIEERCRALGASRTRVVHLGADVPAVAATAPDAPRLVTVGNLVARKRHEDVLEAIWLLRHSHPDLRWEVVGDGPRRAALQERAAKLGIADRVAFRGALAPAAALAAARAATVFVLPSVDEAFGVAYVEAMAAGVPAIGSRGEPGPEEIAACGDGLRLVDPGRPAALAHELGALLGDPRRRAELGARARRNVRENFSWERCGRETVAAYAEALN